MPYSLFVIYYCVWVQTCMDHSSDKFPSSIYFFSATLLADPAVSGLFAYLCLPAGCGSSGIRDIHDHIWRFYMAFNNQIWVILPDPKFYNLIYFFFFSLKIFFNLCTVDSYLHVCVLYLQSQKRALHSLVLKLQMVWRLGTQPQHIL